MSKSGGRASLFATIADGLTGTSQDDVIQVPIAQLRPNARQPRRYFDPEALAALAASVDKRGIMQPLLVRPLGEVYEIVAGERRYRAAQMAGHDAVPAIVKELSEVEAVELALVENLQREDLNAVEETEALISLYALRYNVPEVDVAPSLQRMYFAITKGEPAENTVEVEKFFSELAGMNWKSFVNHRLPLLKLPDDVLQALRAGKLEYTKAREIAKVKDVTERKRLLTDSTEGVLSLQDIRWRVRALQAKPLESRSTILTRVASLRTLAKKSAALEHAATRKKVEALVAKLEALLEAKPR